MAVIKCPDCGGIVSTSAHACPHCGRPMNSVIKVKMNFFSPKVVLRSGIDVIWSGTGGDVAIIRTDKPIEKGNVKALIGFTDTMTLYPGKSYMVYEKRMLLGKALTIIEVDAIT